MMEQTCEPVSTSSRRACFLTFHSLSLQSAVPPPEARTPTCLGLHAMALTAARWHFFMMGNLVLGEKTIMELSLLPDAKYSPSGDHLSPQISCLGPLNSRTGDCPVLRSRSRSLRSLDPERRRSLKMERAPTRSECPSNSLIFLPVC